MLTMYKIFFFSCDGCAVLVVKEEEEEEEGGFGMMREPGGDERCGRVGGAFV